MANHIDRFFFVVVASLTLFGCGTEPDPSMSDEFAPLSVQQASSLGPSTPPAGVVGINSNGVLDLFALGTDSTVWRDTQTSAPAWTALAPSSVFRAASTLSVVLRSDGRLEIFGRGNDNAIWYNLQQVPGGGFSGWISLGGIASSAPAAVQRSDGRLDIYAAGQDGTLWHALQSSPTSAIYSWSAVDATSAPAGFGPIALGGDPAANAGPGGVTVFMRWADASLRSVIVTSSGVTTWHNLGGLLSGNPAVSADGTRVYAIGLDAALWTALAAGSAWTRIGTPSASTSCATAPVIAQGSNAGTDEVFVVASDSQVYSFNVALGVWSNLGGSSTSNVALALGSANQMRAFARGTDGAMWRIDGTGGSQSTVRTWSSWTSLGGSVGLPVPPTSVTQPVNLGCGYTCFSDSGAIVGVSWTFCLNSCPGGPSNCAATPPPPCP